MQTTLIPPFSPEEEERGVELPGLELSAGPSLTASLVGALERFLATDRESATIIVWSCVFAEGPCMLGQRTRMS